MGSEHGSEQDAIRERNLRTLEEVFGMLSSGRYSEIGSLVTEDLYFELPYGPGRKPVEVRGRDAFLELNEKTWPAFSRFALERTAVHPLVDPEKMIIEYRSDGEITATGKPYRNRYIGIFGFRDGLICEWHEFHNPDVPAEAFKPDS
jgi:ketosteroid isomerase-like protein